MSINKKIKYIERSLWMGFYKTIIIVINICFYILYVQALQLLK